MGSFWASPTEATKYWYLAKKAFAKLVLFDDDPRRKDEIMMRC